MRRDVRFPVIIFGMDTAFEFPWRHRKRILDLRVSRWQVPKVEELHFAFDKTLVIIEGPAELLTNRDFIASISLQKAELP